MAGEFELWQLLLVPLFFGLGWFAARVDIRHLVRESRALPQAYFRGLNHVLANQPDRAIDALQEVVEADPQAVELQFALGSLYRQRGDLERAIQVHQKVLNRERLPETLRLQALYAMGQDYLKAGLLDRAEEAFGKLQGTDREIDARRRLLEVYQQEKSWQKAIDLARQLPDPDRQKEIAQFYCELAAQALTQSKPEAAMPHIEAALMAHRQSVRASSLLGDLHGQTGEWEKAIEAWQRIEQQNPAYLAIVSRRLLEAYRKLGRQAEGMQVLRSYLTSYPSLDLLDTVFMLVMELEGPEAGLALIKDELRRNPTVLGLDKLLETQLLLAPPERRGDLELIKGIINTQTRRLARYRCEDCGFKARQFYWRCPACGGWETYPPRRAEEFDQR